MSAGPFTISKYALDNGTIASVRVQPETLAATFGAAGANAPPAGAVNLPGRYPLNTGGRRRRPFSARSVQLQFTATVPAGYSPNSRPVIPIMTAALYNAINDGTAGTYLGSAVAVVGKRPQNGG